MKEKCKCGKKATWIYMPGGGDDFKCDDCVSRGCSCNYHHEGYEGLPTEEDGVEGVDWKWVLKNEIWVVLDEKGREYPCVEFEYEEEGFDIEDDEDLDN